MIALPAISEGATGPPAGPARRPFRLRVLLGGCLAAAGLGWTAIPADGAAVPGTMSVSPGSVTAGIPATLVFTFTAYSTFKQGTVSLTVPQGWTAPAQTLGSAGYTSADCGPFPAPCQNLTVTNTTITVTGVNLAADQKLQITYSSATAPAGATSGVFQASAAFSSVEPMSVYVPPVTVMPCADGTGKMTVSPVTMTASTTRTLNFTYSPAGCGVQPGGLVALTVPADWTQPTQAPGTGGYTMSSAGALQVSGRMITVGFMDAPLGPGQTFTISYTMATAPGIPEIERFDAFEQSTSTGKLVPLANDSPTITVIRAPPSPTQTPSPTTTPTQTPLPTATPAPTPSPPTPSADNGRPEIERAVPAPSWSVFRLPKVLESLVLGALLVALVGFPAELFNRTYEANESRIRRRLPKLMRREAPETGEGAKPLTVIIFFAVAAGLTARLDPAFDFGWAGAAVFVSLAAAIPLAMAAYAYPAEWYQRRVSKITGRFRVIATALLIAASLTLMSWLVHLVPGYVYGLIAGFAARRKLPESQEAKSVLAGVAGVFGLSVVAWIAWGEYAAVALGPHASHAEVIIGAVLAQLAALGITSLVFGLMPFTFMDGYSLRTWNMRVWIGVYAVAASWFALLLIRNNNDLLHKHQEPAAFAEPFMLFAVFGILSVLFWLYFRLRPSPESAGKDPAPQGEAARRQALKGDARKAEATAPGEHARGPQLPQDSGPAPTRPGG